MNYPLDINFGLFSMTPELRVTDANKQTLMYAKEKLSIKTNVKLYADKSMQQQFFAVAADKLLGTTITYNITTPDGSPVGAIKNAPFKSLYKTTFPMLDASSQEIGVIHEENPWIKILDALLSDVPMVGYFINPNYLVELRGQPILRIRKKPSWNEGWFQVEKLAEISAADEKLLLPAMMTFIMLERMRK